MYIVLPVVLVFAAVFFIILAVYGVIFSRHIRLAGRLWRIDKSALTEKTGNEAGEEAGKDMLERFLVKKRARKFIFLDRYLQKLAKKLEKAYLLYRPQEFLLVSLGTAVVFVFIVFFVVNSKYAVMSKGPAFLLLLILVGGIIGFMLPNIYLFFRESKLKRLLSNHVGDMLLLLANYLRAGHGFTRAMELVSREVPSPLGDELKKFVKDVSLGGSVAEALTDLEKRTEDEDLGLVINAIQIQHQVGGNLAEIMDNINYTIRERIRLKGEIKTLTAQGRMTAIIICLLPVAIAVIISFLYPNFIKILFTDRTGQLMLLFAGVAEIVGIILIRKIVQIKV